MIVGVKLHQRGREMIAQLKKIRLKGLITNRVILNYLAEALEMSSVQQIIRAKGNIDLSHILMRSFMTNLSDPFIEKEEVMFYEEALECVLKAIWLDFKEEAQGFYCQPKTDVQRKCQHLTIIISRFLAEKMREVALTQRVGYKVLSLFDSQEPEFKFITQPIEAPII